MVDLLLFYYFSIMISKLILSTGFISNTFGLRTPAHSLVRKPLVKDHQDINPNNSWEDAKCATANNRLEDGPSIPNEYTSANKFVDMTFNGTE